MQALLGTLVVISVVCIMFSVLMVVDAFVRRKKSKKEIAALKASGKELEVLYHRVTASATDLNNTLESAIANNDQLAEKLDQNCVERNRVMTADQQVQHRHTVDFLAKRG